MDKTFDEAIAGIRTAERGVEVREDIAQGMEYVKQYAEELAAQEEERKKAEAREKLPETVAALQKENEMLKQCLLEMSEIVYA